MNLCCNLTVILLFNIASSSASISVKRFDLLNTLLNNFKLLVAKVLIVFVILFSIDELVSLVNAGFKLYTVSNSKNVVTGVLNSVLTDNIDNASVKSCVMLVLIVSCVDALISSKNFSATNTTPYFAGVASSPPKAFTS